VDFEKLHNIGGNAPTAIEDLIENYMASTDGAISVGDLCEFTSGKVRKTYTASATSAQMQDNSNISQYINSIALDSSRALIIYTNYANGSYPTALIVTITGTTITIGASVVLYTSASLFNSCVLIDSSHVVMSYTTQYGLYAITISVAGNVITLGNNLNIVSSSISSTPQKLVLLDGTHVLLTYLNSSTYIFSVVLTISGITTSAGTLTQLIGNSTGEINNVKLDSTHVLITYRNGNSFSAVITIAGDALSVGTSVSFLNGGGYKFSSLALDANHVLISYANNYDASGALYYSILAIAGTTITYNTETLIGSSSGNANYINSIFLDASHILISWVDGSNSNYLTMVILTTSLNSITNISSVTNMSALGSMAYVSPTTLDANRVVITYQGYNNYLYSIVLGISGTIISTSVVTHPISPYVIATAATAIGNSNKFYLRGICSGLTGLIPSTTYYSDNNGNLTTTIGTYRIGVALSTTDLLIQKAFWER